MRIRIQLPKTMRVRIRILLLIKVMRICDHWPSYHPGLQTSRRIQIQLFTLMRIRIRLPKTKRSGSEPLHMEPRPREIENISRGSTFGDFVTIHREGSMQDVTVARLQSIQEYRLPSSLSFVTYCVRVSLWTVKIFLAQPVLGICDILVLILIRIPGSVPLTNGSRSGSRPTPYSTTFFIDFKDAKKNIYFSPFFSYNLPSVTSSSAKKLNFLLKFSVKILYCRHYFSPLNTFIYEGSEAGSGSVPL
jgi:hypothetical protein